MRRPAFVALALVLYVGAAWWATRPANEHLLDHFLALGEPTGDSVYPGDHLQSSYRLWLVGHQLERGGAPWLDPYTFRPEAEPLPNFAGWPFGLSYWPLHRLLGAVGAWNALVLLGIVAAGGLACWWLRELGLPRGAALAGGIAFALAPYRLMQSAEHLLGLTAILLALALAPLERARRGSGWWIAVGVAAVASIPLSGQVHLALGALPFFAAYAFVRLPRRRAVTAAAGALVAGAAAGLLVQRTLIEGSIESGGRELREVELFEAEWWDLIDRTAEADVEEFVFLGWLTPVVAIVGIALLLRARRYALAAVLSLGALVPVLLALGTNLPLYGALRAIVPPVEYTRVPERFMPVASLCIAALVAFAVARLRSAIAVGVAVVALFLDLRVDVFEPTSAGNGDPALAYVRAAPEGRLLELPVFPPDSHFGSVYLYENMEAQRERPLGYSTVAPRAAARIAEELDPLNCGRLNTPRARLLRELNVRYVTVHPELYDDLRTPCSPSTAPLLLARLGYNQVGRDVYARRSDAAAPKATRRPQRCGPFAH